MRIPQDHRSSEFLLGYYGSYLKARLKADPAAGGLVKSIETAQDSLRSANEKERAAAQALLESAAIRDHADFVLVRTVRDFEVMLLAHVKRDQASVTYRQYFPGGIDGFRSSPRGERLQRVLHMETLLAESQAHFMIKTFARALGESRVALEKAVHSWKVAHSAHFALRESEKAERDAWLRSYQSVYGGLLILFPGDREKVESFFRPGPNRRRDATTESA